MCVCCVCICVHVCMCVYLSVCVSVMCNVGMFLYLCMVCMRWMNGWVGGCVPKWVLGPGTKVSTGTLCQVQENGDSELSETGIQKPLNYFKIKLTFHELFTIYIIIRLG